MVSNNKEKVVFNYRENNLNLIRLVAALQVLVGHLWQEFSVPSFRFLLAFKGVTIFFTLSGFLIYWSFDNNPNIRQYWKNRCLRIYPAMIVALVCAIVLMLLLGVINCSVFGNSSFWLWICTQLTFIQEFTPSILHGFGHSNNPNPVLWTISVEMLLYMFIPLLYHWIKRYSRKGKTIVLLIIGLLSYWQNQTGFISTFLQSISDNGYWNIFIHPFCQFFSFAWFFMVGILCYLYKDIIIPKIAGKGGYILLVYLILCYFGFKNDVEVGSYAPNGYALFLYIILTICIFSLAYTKPSYTKQILGNTDISYGVYIYHMLVYKTFSELGLTSGRYAVLAVCLSLGIAYLSWTFIEKKAMKLKSKSLYKGN